MPRTTINKNGGVTAARAAPATQAPPAEEVPTPLPQSQPSMQDGRQDSGLDVAREERIRRAAYEAYVLRGEGPGDAVQDWLQAEAEVDARKD